MKKNKLFKKSAAVLSAALLSTTALTTGVFAADGYVDVTKSTIAQKLDQFAADWDLGMSRLSGSIGTDATWTLSLSDTGKAMAGMFGFDLEWLQDIKVLQQQKLENGSMYAVFEVTINDGSIITMDFLFDTEAMKIYLRSPELSDAYLMVDAGEVFAETASETGMDMTQGFQQFLADPASIYPTSDEIKDLVTNYSDLILANVTEDAAQDVTITASGVSQDATLYTATLTQGQVYEAAKSIVDYAATDETLLSVINKFASIYGMDVTEQVQSGIAEAQTELAEADGEGEGNVVLGLYQDAEGNTVGESFAIYEGAAEALVEFEYLVASDGAQTGVACTLTADGETVTISGTGTAGDSFTGDLVLSYADVDLASFACENVAGDSGAITLALTDAATELDDSLSILSAFAIKVSYYGMTQDSEIGGLALSVLSGGTEIATIALDTEITDGPAIPAAADLGTIYDVNSDTDMESFTANLDPNVILTNVLNAGVPEEFLNQIISMVSGESYE